MRSKKWLIGVLIVGLAIVALSMLNLGENLIYFYTPEEVALKANELQNKDIRVGAMVKPGSINWQPDTLMLKFVATDLKTHEITVTHKGSAPDMFKEGQGVVVEGWVSADGKSMNAKKLFVKHSEEYRKPENHHQLNKAYLEKSIFK